MVTPVYNGEKYLAECIDSVLAQTHDNWEYIILDNCSTDATLSIAQDYARKDLRILVHANDQFLGVIDNHNRAFHLISPDSTYCKVVSADDWIYPDWLRAGRVAESILRSGLLGHMQLEPIIVREARRAIEADLFPVTKFAACVYLGWMYLEVRLHSYTGLPCKGGEGIFCRTCPKRRYGRNFQSSSAFRIRLRSPSPCV